MKVNERAPKPKLETKASAHQTAGRVPPQTKEIVPMSIRKPLRLGLIIGLLAMAFAAVPAMANAATLTENEEPVATGKTVTATSVDATTVLGGGAVTIKCNKVAVHGIVTTNSGGAVVISMEASKVDTAEGCTANGSPTSITPTLNEVNLSGSTGTASFSFEGGGLTESSNSTVAWTGPDAEEALVSGPVTGSLSGTFSGHFTFETPDGTPLTLD